MSCWQSKSILFATLVVIGAQGRRTPTPEEHLALVQRHASRLPSDEETNNKAEPSRSEMITSLFQKFDTDFDLSLGKQELRHVAERLGFQGSDTEWSDNYHKVMDHYHAPASAGMNFTSFENFVKRWTDDSIAAAMTDVSSTVVEQESHSDEPTYLTPADIVGSGGSDERHLIGKHHGGAKGSPAGYPSDETIAEEKQAYIEHKMAMGLTNAEATSDWYKAKPGWVASWQDADRYRKYSMAHMNNQYRAIESMAQPGEFVNVVGNKNHTGAGIQTWKDKSSAGSVWHLNKVDGESAVYNIESQIAPGMYLSERESPKQECIDGVEACPREVVLGFNTSFDGTRWRIQNAAGQTDVYTFMNMETNQYLVRILAGTAAYDSTKHKGAKVGLGDDPTDITAQWAVHQFGKYGDQLHFNNTKVTGVWRYVHGCWDQNGLKVGNHACPPTPAPTSKPTQEPTPEPTVAPTIYGLWVGAMSCEDAKGNRIDPINCPQVRNRHAIHGQQHRTR